MILLLLIFFITACSQTSDFTEPDVNDEPLSFLGYIEKHSGEVEINNDIRRIFNDFSRKYKLIYLPEFNMYESFFERSNYSGNREFLNFAGAVFYVIHLNLEMGEFSEEFIQNEIQSLFLAESAYRDMPHQAYPKFAKYNNGKYTPWPEGMRDPKRGFYLLNTLKIEKDGDNKVAVFEYKNYYFNDAEIYEPGKEELWLLKKAEELDLNPLDAAHYLTVTGEIEELESKQNDHIEIKVCLEEECEYGFKYIINYLLE